MRIAVTESAGSRYDLPDHLKLRVQSGSDKFSIYGPVRGALARTGGGLHVKTAGTTWLEEITGLAESGGEGVKLAKEIYAAALDDIEALCAPYATGIDIDRARLPPKEEVRGLSSGQVVSALREHPPHPPDNP